MHLRMAHRGARPLISRSTRQFSAAAASVVEKQVRVGQHKINFVEAGTGDKGLLLMPGALGTAWTDFRPQIEQLPGLLPQHKLIAWDPPGYGKSRPPEKTFEPDFYHKDAHAAASLMKAIGFERFSILGWSGGGISGMILAGSYPKLVEKLVIWGAITCVKKRQVDELEAIRDLNKMRPEMRKPMEKIYGKENFPGIWTAWIDGMVNIHRLGGDICNDVLGKIRAPTFVLHGAKDRLMPSEDIPHLMEAIKQTELHIFPDGRHNIHLHYAAEFNKLVSDFLKREK